MTRARATATGFTAVLMWSLLAVLTIGSAPVPPLQLNGMCFAIGGAIGLIWCARGPGLGVLRTVPWANYAFGTLGLFGAHLLYFTAFRLAPSAETGLIAYLWPVLIVLMSGLLPGERLRILHVLGALMALAGAAVIVLRGGLSANPTALTGYAVALVFALVWASYSVLSRRWGQVPTQAVTVYCLAAAVLSALAHWVFEPTIWPDGAAGWAAIAALGLGPVGLAFFTWDIGMKRGHIQLLGTASYAAPLLSTCALIATGHGLASARLVLAAILIVGGAGLAAFGSRAKPSIAASTG